MGAHSIHLHPRKINRPTSRDRVTRRADLRRRSQRPAQLWRRSDRPTGRRARGTLPGVIPLQARLVRLLAASEVEVEVLDDRRAPAPT